jgi:hypothetical protein
VQRLSSYAWCSLSAVSPVWQHNKDEMGALCDCSMDWLIRARYAAADSGMWHCSGASPQARPCHGTSAHAQVYGPHSGWCPHSLQLFPLLLLLLLLFLEGLCHYYIYTIAILYCAHHLAPCGSPPASVPNSRLLRLPPPLPAWPSQTVCSLGSLSAQ